MVWADATLQMLIMQLSRHRIALRHVHKPQAGSAGYIFDFARASSIGSCVLLMWHALDELQCHALQVARREHKTLLDMHYQEEL